MITRDEHTVPIDNFDVFRRDDSGGTPGGVCGR
jgi:hypothetical protein